MRRSSPKSRVHRCNLNLSWFYRRKIPAVACAEARRNSGASCRVINSGVFIGGKFMLSAKQLIRPLPYHSTVAYSYREEAPRSAPRFLHRSCAPHDMPTTYSSKKKRPRAPVSYRCAYCGATFKGRTARTRYRLHFSGPGECADKLQRVVEIKNPVGFRIRRKRLDAT